MIGCCNAHDVVQLESCAGAAMVNDTVSFTVWMILVEKLPWLVTYTLLEVGSAATNVGLTPTAIVFRTAKLVALTTLTLLEPELAT